MFHKNLKISESELLPASSLFCGRVPCRSLDSTPPHSLATAPHPGNLSTNHIASSLDCCQGLLQTMTVPLNTAVTPLFLCFKPPVSLSAFLWGV